MKEDQVKEDTERDTSRGHTDASSKRRDADEESSSISDRSSYESRRRHRKKSSKKKHKKESSGRKSHRSSKSSGRKDRMKHRKRSRSYSSASDDEVSYSSDSSVDTYDSRSSDDRRHKKRKKHSSDRKRSSKNKKRSKSKKRKESRSRDKSTTLTTSSSKNQFGKYGILKESDFYSKKEDFEVWLAEVKGISNFNGPKYELMNYFKDYCEDYNTATMPHEKYYNYRKWEMEEYLKKKEKAESQRGRAATDEAQHREKMRIRAEEKRKAELAMVMGSMSKEKVAEMKKQQLLKSEMAHAYKVGDEEKRLKLQRRLEPEQK